MGQRNGTKPEDKTAVSPAGGQQSIAGTVDAFLTQVKSTPVVGKTGNGRLIFAMDAWNKYDLIEVVPKGQIPLSFTVSIAFGDLVILTLGKILNSLTMVGIFGLAIKNLSDDFSERPSRMRLKIGSLLIFFVVIAFIQCIVATGAFENAIFDFAQNPSNLK